MKIRIHIDRAGAIASGNGTWGDQIVDVDLARLTPSQRNVLTDADDLNGATDLTKTPRLPHQQGACSDIDTASASNMAWEHLPTVCAVGEDPTDTVAKILDAIGQDRMAVARRRAELEREWRAEAEAAIAEVLALPIASWISSPPARAQIPLGWRTKQVRSAIEGDPRVKSRLAEAEVEAEKQRAESVRRMEAEVAAAAEAEAIETESRNAWIEAHGSDRLRRLAREGIECRAVYRDEFIAFERPGWVAEDRVLGGSKKPRNAPTSALELLDEARSTLPAEERHEAKLVHWIAKNVCSEDDEPTHDHGPECEWRGYVVIAPYRGEEIVYGAPSVLAL